MRFYIELFPLTTPILEQHARCSGFEYGKSTPPTIALFFYGPSAFLQLVFALYTFFWSFKCFRKANHNIYMLRNFNGFSPPTYCLNPSALYKFFYYLTAVFLASSTINGLQQDILTPLYDEVGEGNGTPLQDSCLENPMDGGAWQAAVHGVAKSQTRLSDFTFTFHFHALEKAMATHSKTLVWKIPWMEEPGKLQSMGLLGVRHD